jgi:tetratricopeptide (TPR) repeat protein
MVKNEFAVIRRALQSAIPFIDAYAITDTGSVDRTPDLIRGIMRDARIPGDVYNSSWAEFSPSFSDWATNRNNMLANAVTECEHQGLPLDETFTLIMDADDMIEFPDMGVLDIPLARALREQEVLFAPRLDIKNTAYRMRYNEGNIPPMRAAFPDNYRRPQMLRLDCVARSDPGFAYSGVIHEYLGLETHGPILTCPQYRRIGGGARGGEDKYLRDAMLLEKAVEIFPEDAARYTYYLAQSYRDAGQLDKAVDAYARRATMSEGWDEEIWSAWYERAKLIERIWASSMPLKVVPGYLSAFAERPQRAEPLWQLMRFLMENECYAEAWTFGSAAAKIPLDPNESLFVERDWYTWVGPLKLAECAEAIGRDAEAEMIRRTLLAGEGLPMEERAKLIQQHT